MANTEGLPDEFVESLMDMSTTSTTTTTMNARQRMLQQRMEIPMSDGQPAAKVVRASNNRNRSSSSNSNSSSRPSNVSSGVVDGGSSTKDGGGGVEKSVSFSAGAGAGIPPPVIGEILERPVGNGRKKKNKHNNIKTMAQQKKVSRFAQQQQRTNINSTAAVHHLNGFPSVHVPLGTFVSSKKKKKNQSSSSSSKATSTSTVASSATTTTKSTQTQNNNNASNNSNNNIYQASSNDAQGMLNQMTSEEIKQHQQELESILSPEMKEFLKRRGGQKQQKTETTKNNTPPKQQKPKQETATTEPITSTPQSPSIQQQPLPSLSTQKDTTPVNDDDGQQQQLGQLEQQQEQERAEKERLAKLVSSIKTYQDLDSAYHAEMKQSHPLEKNSNDEKNNDATRKGEATDDPGIDDKSTTTTTTKDFILACDLLRSTSPRQTLWAARVVANVLENECKIISNNNNKQQSSESIITKHNIPIALPVSLRCLLDNNPITSSFGGILHTYLLQSLYSLLLLYAVPDHRVYLNNNNSNIGGDKESSYSDADLYQDYFMDDAIPTPTLHTAYPGASKPKPLSVDNENNNKNKSAAAAYATSSSATSAEEDGQAFQKDPMWTLLSKMQIIPRLAQLLSLNQPELPAEAWIASCGILAMISQRSPGAASAIIQHKTLLCGSILNRTIYRMQEHDGHGNNNNDDATSQNNQQTQQTAYASMVLLCVIARQSRTAAQTLPIVDILPRLLAFTATSSLEFKIQKLTLRLWRTLLRYGLGLPAFSTMLSLSARHWTLPYSKEYSLSADFVSAFAQILVCAKVARSKRAPVGTTASTSSSSSSSPLQTQHIEILSMASTYLSSMTKQCILLQASTPPTARVSDDGDEEMSLLHTYRWNTARLTFLTAYWSLSSSSKEHQQATVNEEIKCEDMTMDDGLACLMVLGQWIEPGGLISSACKFLISTNITTNDNYQMLEAASCGLIGSVASFLLMMQQQYIDTGSNNGGIMPMIKEQNKTIITRFLRILSGTITTMKADDTTIMPALVPGEQCLSRLGWINQCHFAISKLYFGAISSGILTSTSDLDMARAFAFGTIGRLQRGDESMAAVLFSQDLLFQPHSNPLQQEYHDDSTTTVPSSSSSISTMFLGELCGSDRARTQLDHSFKRNRGFGITAGGFGPFSLDSLLSDADQQPGAVSSSSSSADLILPLGPLWLWQSLSGCIRMSNETAERGVEEASNVVAAVLALILDLEANEDIRSGDDVAAAAISSSSSGIPVSYSATIPAGAKLYFLMNVCLHSETILRENAVTETADLVFDRYWPHLDLSAVTQFKDECLQHTTPSKQYPGQGGSDGGEDEEEGLDAKDKKLFDMLTQTSSDKSSSFEWSREELQVTDAFLEDLISAYNDYGAQYPFFSKCMRVFLSPYFPSNIRLRTLRELRGMWHVLTLESESEDRNELGKVLERTILDGNILDKNASRDSADVLDAIMSLLGQNETSSRPVGGFMLAFSVSLLARNLVIGLSEGSTYEAIWKKRLEQLDVKTSSLVFESAFNFLSNGGGKADLVESVLNAINSDKATSLNNIGGKIDELAKLVSSLQ